mmetsp:Transcript_5293/g.7453  ORF Transcript_5293/g.7453 Transcript_5293/m.7453 type:complete len:462 (+) Transcript_5293:180-1565(+)
MLLLLLLIRVLLLLGTTLGKEMKWSETKIAKIAKMDQKQFIDKLFDYGNFELGAQVGGGDALIRENAWCAMNNTNQMFDYIFIDTDNVSMQMLEYYFQMRLRPGGIMSGNGLICTKRRCLGCSRKKKRDRCLRHNNVAIWLEKKHPSTRLYQVRHSKQSWYFVVKSIFPEKETYHGAFILSPPWFLGDGAATKLSVNPHGTNKPLQKKKLFKTTKISLALLYYQDGVCLKRQLREWHKWPRDIAQKYEFLIIDDGSPEPFRAKHFLPQSSLLNLNLYQIHEDIPWNIGGARNLAVHVASASTVLFMDADVLLDHTLAKKLIHFVHARDKNNQHWTLFDFLRRGLQRPHPAVTLIPKSTYWHVGGCDEDFVGNYGVTDVHFKWRIKQTNDVAIFSAFFLPPLSMLIEKGGTRSNRNATTNKKLFLSKIHSSDQPTSDHYWAIDFLRFSWSYIPHSKSVVVDN